MASRKIYFVGIILFSVIICIFQYQILTLRYVLNNNIYNNEGSSRRDEILGLGLSVNRKKLDLSSVESTKRITGSEELQEGLDKKKQRHNDDSLVVIYNRVPKTASTSFMKVVFDLTSQNKFNAIYVNVSAPDRAMHLPSQRNFIKNITEWNEVKPVLYHGHFPYLNFAQHGSNLKPVYINLIRDPLERMASFYYFMRYGDNKRPHLIRKRMGDKTTLDECVMKNGRDCHPNRLWMQIQYFCGHLPLCTVPGNNWALQQAKRHLSDQYLLVGVTEEIEMFIRILEYSLPTFFKGATEKYLKDGGVFVRKTVKKVPMSEKTIKYFKSTKIWKMENEFYQFALKILKRRYDSIFKKVKTGTAPKDVMYIYQKLKGPFFSQL